MSFGERLKAYRMAQGLSQEKAAERIGVSRQAVSKWESGTSLPSSENLLALASLYGVSLDELAENGANDKRKKNAILRANLTRIAIFLQACALNLCIQPWEGDAGSKMHILSIMGRIVLLAGCSTWMAFNLRYEKDPAQFRKNTRIELLYCIVQAGTALTAKYTGRVFLGAMAIIGITISYILVVNPKYMNRNLVKPRTSPDRDI